jgi:16S rRNA (guanine966-N2)-methyltransferase
MARIKALRPAERTAPASMRIISGRYRGRKLCCPGGQVTRPTSAMVRGAIFNMLGGLVDGEEVLDLYAGTGALGLEAISRGASHAVLVEGDRRAAEALRRNVAAMGAGEEVDIVAMDSLSYLARCRSRFGLVLADPPYSEEMSGALLAKLGGGGTMKEGGVAVIQEPSSRSPHPGSQGLRLWKTRVHGRTRISFYRFDEGVKP